METKSIKSICPSCQKTLPPNVPLGLCPECLIKSGFNTGTESGGGAEKAKFVPPPAPDEIAKHFPQLEILECLGRGGMGVVYRARQPKLNRIVALKILAPEKEAEPRFAERFLREAQTLARLNHPNIVIVHDFGETGGLFYLLMEFVDGLTLRQMMREGRLKPEEALAIVPRICEALQFAHEQGVVHRDIKPENVLLDKQGRVKIADFGIAKIVGGTPLPVGEGERAQKAGQRDGLTQDQVLGTPNYMAPEQVEHPQTVDHRADIYSLGVVFYEMLTGELPLGKFQPPSRMVQVDVRLDEVVLRALEKNPELRYQQVSEVKTRVEAILGSAPVPPAEPGVAFGSTANKSAFVRLFETLSGSAFTSPLALKLINVSALGFFGAFAFLGFVPLPGMERCIGFSGFTGFFGLIGVAFMVESAARRKVKRAGLNEPSIPRPDETRGTRALPDTPPRFSRKAIGFGLASLCFLVATALWAMKAGAYWDHGVNAINTVLNLVAAIGFAVAAFKQGRPARLASGANSTHHWSRLEKTWAPLAFFAVVWALCSGLFDLTELWRSGSPMRAVTAVAWLAGAAMVGVASFKAFGPGCPRGKLLKGMCWLFAAIGLGVWLAAPHVRDDVIRGVVSDAVTGMPISGATIIVHTLDHIADQAIRHTKTDVNGAYRLMIPEFADLLYTDPDGVRHSVALRFQVSAAGYEAMGSDQPLSVRLGERLLHFQLQPKGNEVKPATVFGPMEEVTLTEFNNMDGQEALDLDTGTVFKQPKDMDQWSEEGLAQWVMENGVDLFVDHGPEGVWGLLTTTNAELKLAAVGNDKWGAISAAELIQVLAGGPTALQILKQGMMKVYLPSKEARSPMTFAFETSGGGVGLLQITGYTGKPRGVKIRYKQMKVR